MTILSNTTVGPMYIKFNNSTYLQVENNFKLADALARYFVFSCFQVRLFPFSLVGTVVGLG